MKNDKKKFASNLSRYEPQDRNDISKHRKESSFYKQLSLCGVSKRYQGRAEIYQFVQVRFYGNGSNCYCVVWLNDRKGGVYASGSGVAGGGGYHKESAAMGYALANAGVQFKEDMGGRGDSAMVDSLLCIGRKMRLSRATVLQAHA
jgi:hypothetical protein